MDSKVLKIAGITAAVIGGVIVTRKVVEKVNDKSKKQNENPQSINEDINDIDWITDGGM